MQNHNVAFTSFKYFLCLVAVAFALAATLLIIWFTAAATATGSDPATAISLTDGLNTGILGPNEQRWFRIIPNNNSQANGVEKSLTLTFSPANDPLNQYINFQLFEENQLPSSNSSDGGDVSVFGVAQLVNGDGHSEKGELVWNGQLLNDRTYYIQLLNNSDFPVDYWLVAENVNPPAAANVEPEAVLSAEVAEIVVPETGTDPNNPAALNPNANVGRLKPYETRWYTFSHSDVSDGSSFHALNFSMFFTPDDGNRRHNVNFELFSANEVENWWREGRAELNNFGAGMLVSRDGDFNTGERIWQGTVVKGDTYFLAVQNGTDVEIDYYLYNGDIINPELGPKSKPASPPVFAQGTAPQTALSLDSGQNIGGLNPGDEVWYSFSIADNDSDAFEEMALTMIVTPDDGNRIQRVVFDVFTAEGVRTWSPGNPDGINNVGAGSVVYRDNNQETGERFWSGWVVDNDLYYVRVRNGSDVHIDYWLFNGDVYHPELGQATAASNP